LGWPDPGDDAVTEDTSAVEPLDLTVAPISRAVEFPLLTAAQRDGHLADATAVMQWRVAATSLGTPAHVAVEAPRTRPTSRSRR
jgi:hypothetical protein